MLTPARAVAILSALGWTMGRVNALPVLGVENQCGRCLRWLQARKIKLGYSSIHLCDDCRNNRTRPDQMMPIAYAQTFKDFLKQTRAEQAAKDKEQRKREREAKRLEAAKAKDEARRARVPTVRVRRSPARDEGN